MTKLRKHNFKISFHKVTDGFLRGVRRNIAYIEIQIRLLVLPRCSWFPLFTSALPGFCWCRFRARFKRYHKKCFYYVISLGLEVWRDKQRSIGVLCINKSLSLRNNSWASSSLDWSWLVMNYCRRTVDDSKFYQEKKSQIYVS